MSIITAIIQHCLELFFFFFFKQVAAPAAYGRSQARGGDAATVEATPCSYVVSHMASPVLELLTKDRGMRNEL